MAPPAQPSTTSQRETAVTYFGAPSFMARPFRWQRSSGASFEMKRGFHSGLKLCTVSSVARHEYLVLTKMSRSCPSTASSWASTSPVVCAMRGT
jgi:hypothetical protein